MPHYFDTGFSVRKPMWHGLGEVLDEYPDDWTEARKLAGLEWEPELRPVVEIRCADCAHVLTGGDLEVGFCGACLSDSTTVSVVPGEARVIRNDTGQHLGSVSDQFTPVTNQQMGDLLEALADSDSAVKFETAGSVRDGRQVWALAYLDEPIAIAGDDSVTLPYLAVLNAHDGTGAVKVLPTSVRVVCANTYRAADMQGDSHGQQFVFRHVGNVTDRIEEAKAAIRGARDAHRAWVELANRLASFRIDNEAVENFLYLTIPEPPADVTSSRVKDNIAKDRAVLRGMFESVTCEAHRGTALGLVDAGIEYLDHGRRFRSSGTLMNRTMLRPEPLKARVVANAFEVATAGV